MSVCLYCQKELVTRKIQGRKSLYCSKTCIKKSYKTIKTDKKCKHCFEYLNKQQVRNGQKYCSKVCADSAIKAKSQKKQYRYICKNCGIKYIAKSKERNTYCSVVFTIMYQDKRSVYCSDICCNKRTRRVAKATRRAREKNAPYQSIDPLEVFRRFNYVCYLCGENTNPELRGTIQLNAPELDHVIPLAAGGHHVISNVRCACRKCNIDKSDKLITM